MDVTPDGLVLREIAPGTTADDVQAVTGAELLVPAPPGPMVPAEPATAAGR
jgi:3-oxoacid CoA-transferase subunit B